MDHPRCERTPLPIGQTYLRLRQEAGCFLPIELVTQEEVRQDHGDEVADLLWWWWDPEARKLNQAASPYELLRRWRLERPDLIERLVPLGPDNTFGPTF